MRAELELLIAKHGFSAIAHELSFQAGCKIAPEGVGFDIVNEKFALVFRFLFNLDHALNQERNKKNA